MRILLLVLGVAAGLWLPTFVHELSHALVARGLGFRIQSVAVFPFRFRRSEHGWRFEWSRMFGGVACYPLAARNLRVRIFAVGVAGPGASLLAGAASAWLSMRHSSDWPEAVRACLNCNAVFSVIFTLMNLLPAETTTGPTDGRWIRMALDRGTDSLSNMAQSALHASSMNGLRPRQWDPQLIEAVLNGEATVNSKTYAYNWYADNGRNQEAAAVLDWLLAHVTTRDMKGLWWYEAAWFEGFSRRNSEAARERLSVAETYGMEGELASAAWKARAAIAACEGNLVDLQYAVKQADAALDALDDPGVADATRADLRQLVGYASSRPVHSQRHGNC